MAPALFPSINLVAGDSAMHFTLSRGGSIGLAFDTEAGLCSAIAASVILIFIFYRKVFKNQWDAMNIYVISLFAAEIIQGLGHAVSMKWVIEGEVITGTFCTTQGILQQLGETEVALATLAIAVQTFVTVWRLKDPDTLIASVVVGTQWTFVILFVGIGFGVQTHPPEKYYATPTPYWCWIGENFFKERIASEYFWFWLTLFVSIALYLPLFLLHLDIIRVPSSKKDARWYTPVPLGQNEESTAGGQSGGDRVGSIIPYRTTWTKSDGLGPAIAYPTVYCLLILPWSVIRWIGFKQAATGSGEIHISRVATFIFSILFSLSGVVNAVMYVLTRRALIIGTTPDIPMAP